MILPLSPTVRARVLGEAKFVRAWLHFNLVNLFGSVPLILTTDVDLTASEPRTSVDSVYAQVFADLLSADSLLANDPAPISNIRPNWYTVNALLARVSSIAANGPTQLLMLLRPSVAIIPC